MTADLFLVAPTSVSSGVNESMSSSVLGAFRLRLGFFTELLGIDWFVKRDISCKSLSQDASEP